MDGVSIFWGTLLMLVFLFVPGYALSLALFPRREAVSVVERIGLSLILGVVPQLVLYFMNKNAGLKITSVTSYLVIAFVTLAALSYWKLVQKNASKA